MNYLNLKESFIPIITVFIMLLLSVIYSENRSINISDQIVYINIPENDGNLTQIVEGVSISDYDLEVEQNYSEEEDVRYRNAAELVRDKKWELAEGVYRELIAEKPTSRSYSELSIVLLDQGKISEAKKNAKLALELLPIYKNALFNLAIIYDKSNNDSKAQELYYKVLDNNRYHFGATYNLALIQYKRSQYKKASEMFLAAADLAGGNKKARALYNLGLAYYKQGPEYYQKANSIFRRSLRIRPADIGTRIMIGLTEDKTQDGYVNALDQYEKSLKLSPNDPLLYFYIGMLNTLHNKDDLAKKYYVKTIAIQPNNSKAHYNLGLILMDEKKWDDAARHFESVTAINDAHAEAYFNLGRCKTGTKQYDEAINYYAKSITIRNGIYPEAYYNQGIAYRKKRDYDNAITAYKKAVALNAQYPEAWYNLGIVYMKTQNYSNAISAFEQAISHKESYYQAWLNLGVTYSRLGDDALSIEAYDKALLIKPDYVRAMLNKAAKLKALGKIDSAISLLEKAVMYDSDNHTAYYDLSSMLSQEHDTAKAEKYIRKALELNGDSVEARQLLADILVDNNTDEAISLLKETIDLDDDNVNLRLSLSRALKKAGRINEAYEAIKTAVMLDPSNDQLKIEQKLIFSEL